MFRRIPYYFLLIASALFVALKSGPYIQLLRDGMGGTEAGFLELAWLVAALLAALAAVYVLRRNRGPAPPHSANSSFRLTLSEAPTIVQGAFRRRPALATGLTLVLVAIPIVLVGSAYGWKAFDSRDWILISIGELPIIFVAIRVMTGWK
jgi:hypothetical protein